MFSIGTHGYFCPEDTEVTKVPDELPAARPEMDPDLFRRLKVCASNLGLSIREAVSRFAGPGIDAEYERQMLDAAEQIKRERRATSKPGA